MVVRVGVFGTSWWADSMYLPALHSNPSADVVAVCGRIAQRADEFADRWDAPHALTDSARMFELELDAVAVATPSDTHSDFVMAIWFFGEIDELGATTTHLGQRGHHPGGTRYRPGGDSTLITLRFKTGASGILHVSSMCWEGDGFGQRHLSDAHGADGTLSSVSDWRQVQEVRGLKHSQPGPMARLPIPDRIWGSARRRHVHDSYRDIFRVEHRMIGEFISAIETGDPCGPGLSHGAHIQYLLGLAEASAECGGTMLRVED